MVQQKSKNSVLDKFRGRVDAAKEQAADQPFIPPNQDVIPGINNGVARLTEISFGAVKKEGKNKGVPYFSARGTILTPESIEYKKAQVTVRGMTTRQFIMIEDKKFPDGGEKTVEDCLGDAIQIMKGLGVTDFSGDLETIAEILNESNPMPLFRVTTKPKRRQNKQTGDWEDTDEVVHLWLGQEGLEGYEPPGSASGVTPGQGGRSARGAATPPSTNGHAVVTPNGGVTSSTAQSEPPKAQFPKRGRVTAPPVEVDYSQETDLDVLAAAAQAGKDSAQKRLDELAAEVGIDLQAAEWVKVEWRDIPAALRAAQEEANAEAEGAKTLGGEEPTSLLAKDNVVEYKAGPRAKGVQCVVTRVHEDGTADLTTTTRPVKIFKGVKPEQVSEAISF